MNQRFNSAFNNVYLIEIRKTVWILTESLILTSEPVTSSYTSESFQIYNV